MPKFTTSMFMDIREYDEPMDTEEDDEEIPPCPLCGVGPDTDCGCYAELHWGSD